tara:strand:+ start:2521 stop:3087 length:567 start_codon:yes stop_codon:yes gene_type:complete
MNDQNLLIYESKILYGILNELNEFLNFKIINVSKKQFYDLNLSNFDNYLILTTIKDLEFSKVLNIKSFPIKYSTLLEKINIEFLKQKFNDQSNISINSYFININSREISMKNIKLKLTEKEINTLIYLSKKKTQSVSINELQEKVWSYQSKLETHTVETHIHRLRKKIKEKFKDNNLIVSTKNGYQII